MIAQANGRAALDTLEGPVEAVNERGIRLGERWCNHSRYKPVELPPVGSVVRVQVDERGFIHSLEVLSSATAAVVSVDRDQRITRLAVLKAAAHFAAAREEIKSADVLRIANSWLAWVQELSVTKT